MSHAPVTLRTKVLNDDFKGIMLIYLNQNIYNQYTGQQRFPLFLEKGCFLFLRQCFNFHKNVSTYFLQGRGWWFVQVTNFLTPKQINTQAHTKIYLLSHYFYKICEQIFLLHRRRELCNHNYFNIQLVASAYIRLFCGAFPNELTFVSIVPK